MAKSQQIKVADTRALANLATRINRAHEKCESAAKKGLLHAIEVGNLLREAKKQASHGKWLPWIESNCIFSKRTAQAYMRVAAAYPEPEKSATVAYLTFRHGLNKVNRTRRIYDQLVPELGDAMVAEGADIYKAGALTRLGPAEQRRAAEIYRAGTVNRPIEAYREVFASNAREIDELTAWNPGNDVSGYSSRRWVRVHLHCFEGFPFESDADDCLQCRGKEEPCEECAHLYRDEWTVCVEISGNELGQRVGELRKEIGQRPEFEKRSAEVEAIDREEKEVSKEISRLERKRDRLRKKQVGIRERLRDDIYTCIEREYGEPHHGGEMKRYEFNERSIFDELDACTDTLTRVRRILELSDSDQIRLLQYEGYGFQPKPIPLEEMWECPEAWQQWGELGELGDEQPEEVSA